LTDDYKTLKTLRLVGEVDHFAAYRLVEVVHLCGEKRETSHRDTVFGRISASTTCRVIIEGDKFRAALTSVQAREIASALSHAAYQADQRARVVRGETVRQVTIDGDLVTVTYGGETMPMRLQRTRKSRHGGEPCHECRKRIDGEESWASYRVTDKGWGARPRVGEIRICKDCLPRLKVGNKVAPLLVQK
jgi:hypothetical protein